MDRREALRSVALLMGGAISATTIGVLFDSCNQESASGKKEIKNLFNAEQQTLITEMADIIIPTTSTPGAKAAGVGPFITMMMNECYSEKAQKTFLDGLEDVEKRSKTSFDKGFMQLAPTQRNGLLTAIYDETTKQKAEDKAKEDAEKEKNKDKPNPKGETEEKKSYFFSLMRDLTLLGYFTSEIGATKALNYVAIPGRYDGNVDLKPDQKAWAI